MFDHAMAAFESEMQAKARLRRPRPAATRRTDELDNLSGVGAQCLCQIIKGYWAKCGFANVKTEIILVPNGRGEGPAYAIKSNLLNALPPTGGANGHAR
jgi:hypothetical protein